MRLSTIFLLAIIISSPSCTSTSTMMNSWLGSSKQDLIMRWGPPVQVTGDGAEGEILVYATRRQLPSRGGIATSHNPNPTVTPGAVYWEYRMFWVNSQGEIYHWLAKNERIPPQQMDLSIYHRR